MKFFWFFLSFLSFIFLIYFIAFNRYLLIKSVNTSISPPSKERVLVSIQKEISGKKFGFVPANNFLFFNKIKVVTALLAQEPSFKDFSVKYSPSEQSLSIDGQARQPVGTVCIQDECYSLDENGIVFPKSETEEETVLFNLKDSNAPEINLGEQVLPEKLVDFVLSFKRINSQKIKIKSVTIEEDYLNAGFLKIVTEKSWFLLVLFDSSPEAVSENLELILREEIKDNQMRLEYIDLRYKDKAYYKLSS